MAQQTTHHNFEDANMPILRGRALRAYRASRKSSPPGMVWTWIHRPCIDQFGQPFLVREAGWLEIERLEASAKTRMAKIDALPLAARHFIHEHGPSALNRLKTSHPELYKKLITPSRLEQLL